MVAAYAPSGLTPPTWNLLNIKALDALGIADWPRLLSLNPVSLQRFSIDICFNEDIFSELARFRQLVAFTMNVCVVEDSVLSSEEYTAFFPLLEEFTLMGDIRHLRQLKCKFPNLKRLALCCTADEITNIHAQSSWLQIYPSEVHWELSFLMDGDKYGGDQDDDWEVSAVQGDLRFFLLQFTSAEHLSVPLQAKDTLIDLLEKLSNDGSLPYNWKSVSFHNSEGENNETVSVETIAGT